jgi:hypothetical protein
MTLLGLSQTTPWMLNSKYSICDAQCGSDFWPDWKFWHSVTSHITDEELKHLDTAELSFVVTYDNDKVLEFIRQDISGATETDGILRIDIKPKTKTVQFLGWNGKVQNSGITWTIGKEASLVSHFERHKHHKPFSNGIMTVDLSSKNIVYSWDCSHCQTAGNCLTVASSCDDTSSAWSKVIDLEQKKLAKLDRDMMLNEADVWKNVDVHINTFGGAVFGWVPNSDAAGDPKSQYIIIGKYSVDLSMIKGIFISGLPDKYGVFIIRAYPSDVTNAERLHDPTAVVAAGPNAPASPAAGPSLPYSIDQELPSYWVTRKYLLRLWFSFDETRKSFLTMEDPSINLGLTYNALTQRCTSNNCKIWYEQSGGIRNCHSCWTKADMNLGGVPYENWPGKNSYSPADIAGQDQEDPWSLTSIGNIPYSYCNGYDADGICKCYPQYYPATPGKNYCLKINKKFQSCIAMSLINAEHCG